MTHRSSTRHWARCLTLLIALATVFAGAAIAAPTADGAPALYSITDTAATPSRSAARAERIAIDPTPLRASASTLALPLPNGQRAIARLDSVERRGDDNLAWRGMVDGGGPITLTLLNGIVVGRAETQDGPYEITTSANGPLLLKLDMAGFDACGNTHADADYRPSVIDTTANASHARSVTRGGDPADSIDVMIIYTAQAETGAGGEAQIEATAQAAVDVSNTAFMVSDMVQRYNLIEVSQTTYNDSGSVFNDRNFIQADATINALRDTVDADLVGLFTENGGGFCGVAFLMGSADTPAGFAPFGYQVTARSCAVGNFTYAHEHGHNMALQHNPANGAPPASALFVYAYGHWVGGEARTIMGSGSLPVPRVGQFSNPDVDFLAPAMAGVPSGLVDLRDNTRVADFVAPFTANWRTSGPLFADGFESGDTSAWPQTNP